MSLAPDLLELTRSRLTLVPGVQAVVLAPGHALQQGMMGEHPATIHGWAWRAPALTWARVALLEAGERADIFSMLALPDPAYDLPLFAAEIVRISGQVTVVALDWLPLYPRSADLAGLQAIRERFSHFPPGGELPPWAAAAFSPHALFSRPRGAVPDEEIMAAYRAYLEGYLELAGRAAPAGNPARTRELQRAYCREHLENDPGASMLAKIFGADWTAGYARGFLFHLDG